MNCAQRALNPHFMGEFILVEASEEEFVSDERLEKMLAKEKL